ncbi:hypothetical protein JCM6882_001374 [Rhodosporidiobolus microsporus]
MALELDWSALDAQLTHSTTRFLSNAFSSAPRPNFLGPLTVTTFSFGDHEPSLELTDIRDVYKEFLVADEEDDDEDPFPPPPPPPPMPRDPPPPTTAMSDVFETRSASNRPFPFSPPQPAHHQPPSASLFSPGLLHHSFAAGSASPFPGGGPTSRSRSRSHSPAPFPFPHPGAAGLYTGGGGGGSHPSQSHTHPHSYAPPSPTPSHSSLPPQMPSSAPSPSLQAHLRLAYTGNLSLGISTSLLINYPSPGFMSLPLQLTLTSLAFEGTLVVAFEGGKRRIHLSLLDPGPAATGGQLNGMPGRGLGNGGVGVGKETPGMRLLKSAVVESEVGQADKHVLKNVGKVEKFVLEVARKTIENELVFPNFQTIVF